MLEEKTDSLSNTAGVDMRDKIIEIIENGLVMWIGKTNPYIKEGVEKVADEILALRYAIAKDVLSDYLDMKCWSGSRTTRCTRSLKQTRNTILFPRVYGDTMTSIYDPRP